MRYRAAAVVAALMLPLSALAGTWTETVEVEVVVDDALSRNDARDLAAERVRIEALRQAPQYVQEHEVLRDEELELTVELLSAAMMEIEPLDESWDTLSTGQQQLVFRADVTVDTEALGRRAERLGEDRAMREELEQLANRHYFHTRRGPLAASDPELTRRTVNVLATLDGIREDGREVVASFSQQGLDAVATESERAIESFYREFLPEVARRIRESADAEAEIIDANDRLALVRVRWDYDIPPIPERYESHLVSVQGEPNWNDESFEARANASLIAAWHKTDEGYAMLRDYFSTVASYRLTYPGFTRVFGGRDLHDAAKSAGSLSDLDVSVRLRAGKRRLLPTGKGHRDSNVGRRSVGQDVACLYQGRFIRGPHGVPNTRNTVCLQGLGEQQILIDRLADEPPEVAFAANDYEIPKSLEDSDFYPVEWRGSSARAEERAKERAKEQERRDRRYASFSEEEDDDEPSAWDVLLSFAFLTALTLSW